MAPLFQCRMHGFTSQYNYLQKKLDAQWDILFYCSQYCALLQLVSYPIENSLFFDPMKLIDHTVLAVCLFA